MTETSFFKNPGPPSSETRKTGRSSTPASGEPAGTSTSPMSTQDTGKKVSGLVQTGTAIIGGQVAAAVLTNIGLNMLGATAAPGTVIRKAGVVVAPILLGLAVTSLSKNEKIQEAGLGMCSAGVAAGVNMLMPATQFYAVADAPYALDMGLTADGYASELMLDAGRDLDALYGRSEAQEVEFVEIAQLA